jgi:hypothetical protein
VREEIRNDTDRKLAEMHNRQKYLEQKLDFRTIEERDLRKLHASEEALAQATAEIAALQQSLQELKASRADKVAQLLESALRREEEAAKASAEIVAAAQSALKDQEIRHVAAMREEREASTAAYIGLSNHNTQQYSTIIGKVSEGMERLADSNKEGAQALREVGATVAERIQNGNIISAGTQSCSPEL